MDPAQVAAFAAHFQQPLPPQQPPFSAVNHPIPAANPTPNPSQPLPSHPSYTEMIMRAIEWENSQGKEGGSSKRAIAKYIDRVYTDLPPTHSALLSHHLKRLKNSGQLAMIKNSYQLPSLAPQPPRSVPVPVPVSVSMPVSDRSGLPQFESLTPKRKPGRPSKVKVGRVEEEEEEMVVVGVTNGKRPRGRPPKEKNQQQEAVALPPPVVVGNGLVKRRGRPAKKVQYRELEEEEEAEQERVEADQERVVNVMNEAVYVDVPVKRKAGRPAKLGVGRGRERLKRIDYNVVSNVLLGPVMGAIGKKKGWPKGRPRGKKVAAAYADVAVNVVGKKRGRKPKGSVLMPVVPTVEKRLYSGKPRGRPKKKFLMREVERTLYSGKPRGRPKKNSALVKHTSGESGQPQEVDNEDLLLKLEGMQSKLRDAVRVLRPHFAYQSAPDALSAMQQLEELSAMNVTPSPAITAPPEMTMPMDVTNPPQSTPVLEISAPSAPSLTAPTMMAFTASPGMNVPLLPFSMNVPSGIENQQPVSWIPSNDAQI